MCVCVCMCVCVYIYSIPEHVSMHMSKDMQAWTHTVAHLLQQIRTPRTHTVHVTLPTRHLHGRLLYARLQ